MSFIKQKRIDMKKQVLIGLLALVIISCNKTDDVALSLSLIHQGVLYGAGEENISEENLVIEKKQDWKDLLSKINTINNESENFTEMKIDFDEFIVVACFDKVHSSGGSTIAITETEVNNNEVLFNVSKESSNGFVTSVITQPYYLAKFPKTNKKITFTE
ncbi:MAG: hypothetical protein ACI8ZM_004075 [Crocinitomix sp.]